MQDFSITQILRKIDFEDSRSAKSAILTHLQVLYFKTLKNFGPLIGCHLPN